MTELWKKIPGFSSNYEASSLGRIRSLKNEIILKPIVRKSGHLRVDLGKGNSILVHQIVLLAFCGPRPNGLVSLHLDSTPSNNALSNLRYGTRSENIKMDFATGTRNHFGENAPAAKLNVLKIYEIRASSLDAYQLAKTYGVTPHTIRAVRRKSTWAHVL